MKFIIAGILILGVFLFAKTPMVKKLMGGKLTPELNNLIEYKAQRWGVDPALIKAHAFVESSFNPEAQNPADPSYGLMQITPALAYDYGLIVNWKKPSNFELELIYKVENNLDVACWFIAELHRQLDFDGAIQAYNVGLRGYREGRRNSTYLKRVKKYYAKYS